MKENKEPTEIVRVDSDTKRKLRLLAKANERSMAAHIRWLVNRDYERISPPQVINQQQ